MVPLFLSWTRPSPEQQKSCTAGTAEAPFNYDPKHHSSASGASSSPPEPSILRRDGFHVNHSRTLLGSGERTFLRAKSAIQSWRHFGLGWAFVDPETPVREGERFCVCVKEVVPWLMMPLKIAYVKDSDGGRTGGCSAGSNKAEFCFGSGTLRGHLLAGEEHFSVERDENDQVWYEIFSFSKPAHFLSALGYPYVKFRQKHFAQQSTQAVLNHVKSEESSD